MPCADRYRCGRPGRAGRLRRGGPDAADVGRFPVSEGEVDAGGDRARGRDFADGAQALAAPRGAPAAASHRGGLIAPTPDGKLQGKPAEGIDQWLGVPYAAPPVGALRWAAPRPARAGLDPPATSYGGRCAQLASGNGPRVDNEDCLYLNVYAPPGTDRGWPRDHGLPVLFMIHGGGLTSGAGDQHDGSLIVNTDHIMVVSINYRLGLFGFLAVPGLGSSPITASGNYGLLDQEAALRWVQRNIAAFGGDPAPGHDRRRVRGRLVGVRAA